MESNLNNRLESIFSHKSNRIESKLFLANRNALTDIAHNIEIQCARYSVPGSSYINRNRPGRAGPGRCLASTYSLLPTTDRRTDSDAAVCVIVNRRNNRRPSVIKKHCADRSCHDALDNLAAPPARPRLHRSDLHGFPRPHGEKLAPS